MVSGTAVILATQRSDRAARIVGLVLVAGGGLFTAAAKIAYFPVLAMAFVVCVATAVQLREAGPKLDQTTDRAAPCRESDRRGRRSDPGRPTVAGAQLPGANVHNLIFTTVLPEVPGAAQELGLPAAAAMYAGSPSRPQRRMCPVVGKSKLIPPPTGRGRWRPCRSTRRGIAQRDDGAAGDARADLPYLTSEPYAPGAEFLRAPRDAEPTAALR